MSVRDNRRPRRGDDRPRPIDRDSFADEGLAERDALRGIRAPQTGRVGRASMASAAGSPAQGLGGIVRFLVFALVLGGVLMISLLTVLRPVARVAALNWAYDNASAQKIPFVADLIREDLGTALTSPASTDATVVEFDVVPGDTPVTVAARLLDAGLITNQRAFIFTAIQRNLAANLKDGTFLLKGTMTPDQVVAGLVDNRLVIKTVNVTFREGLRIEQMVAKLETVTSGVDPQAFLDIARAPSAELLAEYPWLGLPEGRSLEGFLYPATYTLITDGGSRRPVTTALDLVKMMLTKFHEVAAPYLAVPADRKLTFYQVLTLASIVEKEAALDSERATIAGVYQNRLNGLNKIAKILNADPTVIYAVDTMALAKIPLADWKSYSFWNVPATPMGQVQVTAALAGYQTYTNGGLIPGPICSPSLQSIQAALTPDTASGYLFFLALPDKSGAHVFAKTQAEHDANKKKYGYQ